MKQKIAVVLLSGGLDSTTCLSIARQRGFQCYGLSFDYGQKHKAELKAATNIAKKMQLKQHRIVKLDAQSFTGSSLTDADLPVTTAPTEGIPTSYVPARNTIFLSFALGWAEVLQADAIFIGVNAVDYSGYPDCRPEYIQSFQAMANLATKAGVEGNGIEIITPLLSLSKVDIIKTGKTFQVDYSETVSCYQATEAGLACGVCDSCRIRRQAFFDADLADPTRYV